MEVFAIWFEKHPYRISKDHGLNDTSLGLTKCNINGIIVFCLTQEIICIISKRCLKKEHNLKLHPSKRWFFHTHVKHLGDMIYLRKLKV
jgi:hypothetical protein